MHVTTRRDSRGPRRLWSVALLACVATLASCASRMHQSDGAIVDVPAIDAADAEADAGPVRVSATFDAEGHRGARGLRPENTLPAFEIALDLGVDTLETDLHYSADGALVVWHDPIISAAKCRIDPNASAPLPPDPATSADDERRIRRLTVAQLHAYRCDRVDAAGFPAQAADPGVVAADRYSIVTLDELIDFVAQYANDPRKTDAQRARARAVRFDIESKRSADAPQDIGDGFDGTNPGPFEQAIVETVHRRNVGSRIIVQSFDRASLAAVHMLDATLPLSFLTLDVPVPSSLVSAGVRIWAPNAALLTRANLSSAHAAGLLVLPWTVNDAASMRRLAEMGVDGMITDRPDMLLGVIAR